MDMSGNRQREQHRKLGSQGAILVLGMLLCACGGSSDSPSASDAGRNLGSASGRALYVSATAAPGGDGSRQAPFDSLQALQAASAPGDALVVLPAPLDIPPLDGGIALKPNQRLIGAGPDVLLQRRNEAVAGAAERTALPRIRNSSALNHQGDAVQLAAGSEVSNLVITQASRGAIYGMNVPGARVRGNDVSGYNTACAIGFSVRPFPAPTTGPYIGIPLLLPAGWAGIMVDADSGSGAVEISDNYVHDSACGNGIDLRLFGDADYLADISGNFVTQLKHGPLHQTEELHLVHAITTQVTGTARLEAKSVNNTQTYIGAPGADCEGLFLNVADSGTAIWDIDRNRFAHGIGGFSCNGMELIISNGNGHAEVTLSNSYFEDNPGDMFEQANLGSGSTMILDIDNVTVKDTHERGGDPDAGGLPFNLGECLLMGSTGTDNTTILRIRDSEFSGCNNGLSVLSGANLMTNLLTALTTTPVLTELLATATTFPLTLDPLNLLSALQNPGALLHALTAQPLLSDPLGTDGRMEVDVRNTAFIDNSANNVVVGVIGNLRQLDIKIQDSDFSRAGGNAVLFRKIYLGEVEEARIDFGGGALASTGGNCILGGEQNDVQNEGFVASMQRNWWGQPGGPDPDKVSQTLPDSVDASHALGSRPAVCSE